MAKKAGVAGAAPAHGLGTAHGPWILVVRSIGYGPDRPVESFVAFHRGDGSRFAAELTRGPQAAARPW